MPSFLGHQCWSSFHDKSPAPGAKAMLTVHVLICVVFFFSILKKCIPDSFNVFCSDKDIQNCAGNHICPEQAAPSNLGRYLSG